MVANIGMEGLKQHLVRGTTHELQPATRDQNKTYNARMTFACAE